MPARHRRNCCVDRWVLGNILPAYVVRAGLKRISRGFALVLQLGSVRNTVTRSIGTAYPPFSCMQTGNSTA